ncbi:MAG: EamA family transporter RarD [Thermodesulfobacteriota bacterium]
MIGTREQRLGVLSALGAFAFWGIVPVYFKAVGPAGPSEILCHRIFWSVPFTALLLTLGRNWGGLARAVRSRRVLLTLFASAILVASNWLIFIYSVNSGQLLAASLGYFINPLINVLLGLIFLRERLRPRQILAVLLAAAGTINLTASLGTLPWISLALGFSFGFYGLLRKTVKIDSLGGLFVETSLLFPLSLAYFAYLFLDDRLAFGYAGWSLTLLLALAGVVTSAPLLAFTAGARRLRYATLGLIQYVAPTLQFLLAVLAYSEPFTRTHLITFTLIWAGLIVFMLDSFAGQGSAV